MGWGFSLRTFQTFQVQVQAWKVVKHVVYCCGLDSPVVQVIHCVCLGELECGVYESESSVCSATVSAERVRDAAKKKRIRAICMQAYLSKSDRTGRFDRKIGEPDTTQV
ncbi:hypothetical protein PIB30_040550 [Stylosanthes scabra]|uniref:Uncharacterized protein n=1 Tax=Stylosanthes scabra TaxID=79078 RepID=A0ABU6UGD9_9FABA|nr:hypothetical protein [Stylosanthes scabra]